MGNGVSTDQGNLPAHGKRDVGEAADTEQHDWSQLAEAPITKQPNSLLSTEKPYKTLNFLGRSQQPKMQKIFVLYI